MAYRLLVVLALATGSAGFAPLSEPMRATPLSLADRDAGPMTGKERQKACTEQWRKFSAAEKTAQGPAWPQFYTKCVKRLKAPVG